MDIIYGNRRVIRIDENCILIIIVDNNNNNRGSPGRMKKCLERRPLVIHGWHAGLNHALLKKKKEPEPERKRGKEIISYCLTTKYSLHIYASNPFCFSLKYH